MRHDISKGYVTEPLIHKEIEKLSELFGLALGFIANPNHYYTQPLELYEKETIEIDNGHEWE